MLFQIKMSIVQKIYYLILLFKFLYYGLLCHIIPVEKNKIAFCCHVGRSGINCNPKYILKEIIAQKLPYKLVWICNKEFIQYDDEFKEVEFVDFKDVYKRTCALASSKIWVENIYKIATTIDEVLDFLD